MKYDFTYCNPTKIYFGRNSLQNLKEELKNYGTTVMIAYGGGSIKKIGLYDEVIAILKDTGKKVVEYYGIMSNPTLDKMLEGAKLAKENNVDLILAVGGGSVVDCSKAVSVSAWCEGDPWEKYFLNGEPVTNKIIPVASILTMVGTGSEMNGGAVITNTNTKDKIGRVFDDKVFPKFSILNPEYTYSLPKYQMISGFYDIMSHLIEQCFSGDDDNTSDYLTEGLLKSLIYSSTIAIKNPEDYEARSNIMWTATLALNTLVGMSKTQDWEVHMIGQQVGAYTNCAHGMSLAAVSMAYYRHIYKYGLDKFVRYAVNVWNVNPEGKTKEEIALQGLDEMEKYMKKIGLVMNISELGVTEDMLEPLAKSIFRSNNGYKELSIDDVYQILKESM